MDLTSKLKCIQSEIRWKGNLLHPVRTVDISSLSSCHKNWRRCTSGKQWGKNCVVYHHLLLYSIKENVVKITIIINIKMIKDLKLWRSSELAVSAWVNLWVCDEIGDIKEQVWLIEQAYLHPYWNHSLSFCSRRVCSCHLYKKQWTKKGIEMGSKIKCDLYIIFQKWGT